MLLLKGHRADNNYDGYDPHHHIMLLDMTISEYERDIVGIGNVFPGKAYAHLIIDPKSLAWCRDNLRVVGYDWMEPVEPQHTDFYAFAGRHDGIDVAPFSGGHGEFVGTYYSSYTNGNGYHASADIFRLQGEVPDSGDRNPWAAPEYAQTEPLPQYEVTGEGTAARSPFWDRRWRVLVGDGGETALDVSQLRCTFNVEKTIMSQPNLSVVTIYNLSPDTEVEIIKEGQRLIIEAGYQSQDQYGLIFDGTIIHPSRGKEDATTFFLTLQGLDGDNFMSSAFINQSLSRQQPVRSVIDACLQKASVPVETGLITDTIPSTSLIRGRSLFGSAFDQVLAIARSLNAALYIEDGKVNLVAASDLPEGEIFQLDETSGLIGFPQQTEMGISFQALLNPRLKLNDQVYLNNELINQSQTSPGQLRRPLAASGIYRITKINHVGDTRGNEWYTECEAVAQDQWNPW